MFEQILACMRSGADVISTNLPQVLTAGFLVLDWEGVGESTEEATSSGQKRLFSKVGSDDGSQSERKASRLDSSSSEPTVGNREGAPDTNFSKKLTASGATSLPDDEEGDNTTGKPKNSNTEADSSKVSMRLRMSRSQYASYCLDMADVKYARDTTPLIPGCQCHACRYSSP